MADNVTLNSGAGGSVAATDDIGGIHFQLVKIALGAMDANNGPVSASNPMPVTATDSSTQVDDAAFTPATSKIVMIGATADEVTPDSVNEGDGGAIRMSLNRNLYVQVRDAAGNERGLNVDASGQLGVLVNNGAGAPIPISDNASSITVDGTVTANAGSGPWPVTDNAGSLTVDNGGTFAVQDSQVLADNAAFTDGTSKLFPSGFIYDEVAGTALTENDVAAARVNANRSQVHIIEDGVTRGRYATVSASNALKVDASSVAVPVTDNSGSLTVDGTVTASNVSGDVAHDSVDSGNPVKVGGKAGVGALPAAVADGDRTNILTDRYGRQMVGDYDIGLQKFVAASYSTAQTGTTLITTTSGKRIIITGWSIGTSGTTAGRVTIWFGASADTTYSEGTDQVLWDGDLTPSASATPGIVQHKAWIPAINTNDYLKVTTSATITVRIIIHYIEVTP